MAFGKSVANRFLDLAKTCSGQIRSAGGAAGGGSFERGSVFRRIFPESSSRGIQWRPIVQAAVPPDRISMPIGVKLFDRISWPKGDNLRRDLLTPPPLPPVFSEEKEGERVEMAVTLNVVRKALKASQMELVRSRIRGIAKSSVSLSEFLRICSEVSGVDKGPELARSLDESGVVIVLGNIVFLRPDQVAKAIENIIPLSLSLSPSPIQDTRKEELMDMERKKAMIDKKAKDRARMELWCGLGFLAVQTAGFMRLTFWELSWDVMEPICFYVTSFYFMAGYVFFMRTSTEPSFEGFFNRRFSTKQRRLMKAYNFDLSRFNELKGIFHSSPHSPPPSETNQVDSFRCDCMNKRNAFDGYAC